MPTSAQMTSASSLLVSLLYRYPLLYHLLNVVENCFSDRKQVDKIREFIRANNLCPFKVGSVEEFQGQERDVIIVSTVRSNESYVGEDVLQHLGFLRSPKRFNVTVTRAKSLLIVIGNPHLLAHDEHWGPFLRHCVQRGSYTGCDLPRL